MLSNSGISWLVMAGLFLGGVSVAEGRDASVRVALCNGGSVHVPINRGQDRPRDDCSGVLCHGVTERRRKGAD